MQPRVGRRTALYRVEHLRHAVPAIGKTGVEIEVGHKRAQGHHAGRHPLPAQPEQKDHAADHQQAVNRLQAAAQPHDRQVGLGQPVGKCRHTVYRGLDTAKEAAQAIVRRLGRRREPAEMMVVAFASTAQVISGFESNRAILRDAVESVEPTDEEADLEAALALAGAFASQDESADQPPPQVVLISDGGVGPPPGGTGQGFTLQAGSLRFVGVGPPPQTVNNVGVAAFSARRDYQDPQRVLAFARLVNSAPQPVETTATLRVDDWLGSTGLEFLAVEQRPVGLSRQAASRSMLTGAADATG